MGHSQPLFRLFSFFQTNISIFTTNICEKMSIQQVRCWQSNSQHSVHESPPITTRPGLPPLHKFVFDAGKIKGFTALALEREILGSTKKVIKLEQSCKSSITCNEQCIEMVHISGQVLADGQTIGARRSQTSRCYNYIKFYIFPKF